MSHGYYRPNTLDEAFSIAAENPGARYIAGGTDLLVQMRNGQPVPPTLISLRGLPELNGIEPTSRIRIGAGVPLSDVQVHPALTESFPALVASIASLGSPQIRNVATIGGNLANASPAADTAPPLLVYGASVELRDAQGAREVALKDFFLGPGQTSLRPDEILSAILVDRPAEGTRSVFLRKGRVTMDLPIASVAALGERAGATHTSIRLAAGSVAPVPLRLIRSEEVVEGTELGNGARTLAMETAHDEVSPITDQRATADYRRHLTSVLVGRALQTLASEAA